MRQPFFFKDRFIQTTFERVFSSIDGVNKRVSNLMDNVDKKLRTIVPSEGGGAPPPQVSLPTLLSVAASRWGWLMMASFTRLQFWRFKGIKCFEWEITNTSSGDGSPGDPYAPVFSGTEFVRTISHRLFHILDSGALHWVRVRCIGDDGSSGPWSAADSTTRDTILTGAADDTPPTWSGGLPALAVETTDAQVGWRLFKMGKAMLSWNKATDDTAMQCYYIAYRKTTDDEQDAAWKEERIWCAPLTGLTLKNGGGRCYSWIHNLELDYEYEFKILAVDWANNSTGWNAGTTTETIVRDVTPPGTLTIADGGTTNEKELIGVSSTTYVKVLGSTVASDAWYFTVQYKINVGAWVFHKVKIVAIDACMIDKDGNLDATDYHVPIENLLPGVEYKFRAKQTAFNWQTSASWSNELVDTASPVVIPTPTIFSAHIVPLWTGWFKRVHCRFRFVWSIEDAGGTTNDWAKRWVIQITMPGGLYHSVVVDEDGIYSAGYRWFDVYVPMLKALATYGVPNADSGYDVQIWGRANLESGVSDTANILYALPDTEDTIPDIPSGYPKWEMVKGAWRTISVQCVPETWNFPNTFSHFTVHARIKGGTDWIPDAIETSYKLISKDRVHVIVSREACCTGNPIFIPFKLWYGVDNERRWLAMNAFQGGQQNNLEIKVVCHILKYNAATGTVELKTAQEVTASHVYTSAVQASDEYEDVDSLFANMVIPIKAIVAYGGDVLFAPSVRVGGPFGNLAIHSAVYVTWEIGDACPFTAGDILVVCASGTYYQPMDFDPSTTGQELLKVLNVVDVTALLKGCWLSVTRGYAGTTANIKAWPGGCTLVKVGRKNETYRYMYMDASDDVMRVMKTVSVDT